MALEEEDASKMALDEEDALLTALDEEEALMLVDNGRFLPILAVPDPRRYWLLRWL